jgi:mRNA-degrading endonuclease RelE of RelBE toxin-antitoxin system
MSYTIQIKPEVKKHLLSIEGDLRRNISRRINQLSNNPTFPFG